MCSSLTHEIGKWDNQAVYPSSDAEAAQQAEAAKIEAAETKKVCIHIDEAAPTRRRRRLIPQGGQKKKKKIFFNRSVREKKKKKVPARLSRWKGGVAEGLHRIYLRLKTGRKRGIPIHK